jgi:hypothetical protein
MVPLPQWPVGEAEQRASRASCVVSQSASLLWRGPPPPPPLLRCCRLHAVAWSHGRHADTRCKAHPAKRSLLQSVHACCMVPP